MTACGRPCHARLRARDQELGSRKRHSGQSDLPSPSLLLFLHEHAGLMVALKFLGGTANFAAAHTKPIGFRALTICVFTFITLFIDGQEESRSELFLWPRRITHRFNQLVVEQSVPPSSVARILYTNQPQTTRHPRLHRHGSAKSSFEAKTK